MRSQLLLKDTGHLYVERVKYPADMGIDMAQEVHSVEEGNAYYDTVKDVYVVVSTVFADEDGEPQIRVREYRDLPPKAYNIVRDERGATSRISLHADDILSREREGELIYEEY